MRGRVAFVALSLLLLAAAPVAQDATIPLGDLGSITHPADEPPPHAARIASLLEFIFAQFPTVEMPPVSVIVMTYEEYETDMAQRSAGPRWREWLTAYRKQTDWATRAQRLRDRDELVILTYQNPPDDVIIHEALHHILEVLEVEHPEDAPILNFENMVVQMMAATEVSRRYRAFLRDRPWQRQ